MPGPAANENLQRALRDHERKLRGQEILDLQAVLKTPEGRRLYYRIIFELCNLLSDPCDLSIKDGECAALHAWRYAGMQAVGRQLMAEAQTHCEDLWDLAIDERKARRRADLADRELIHESAGADDQ